MNQILIKLGFNSTHTNAQTLLRDNKALHFSFLFLFLSLSL